MKADTILLRVAPNTDRSKVSNLQISDKLLCLFNAEIEEVDGDHHVVVPEHEIEAGTLETDRTYRIAVIAAEPSEPAQPGGAPRRPQEPQPPVEVGEIRYVEIEDIGKQGDGIARVERGYVIIVPGAEMGEQVKIEVSEVKSNFAVGEIIDEELA